MNAIKIYSTFPKAGLSQKIDASFEIASVYGLLEST